MKTSNIISTIVSLSLVFFMSVTSIANSNTGDTGDIVKAGVKKQIEVIKNTTVGMASPVASENEYSHLRFDANKFNMESGLIELPMNSTDYLRFDVNNYSDVTNPEITELPVNEFEYLRFDVNNFDNAPDLSEMPVK